MIANSNQVDMTGFAYLDQRFSATRRIAILRAMADQIESQVEICDLIYRDSITLDSGLDQKSLLSTAVTQLDALVKKAVQQ